MSHHITDLRGHLFATLQALRDPKQPMDIERAKAVAEVAKVVIDSAKVEVDYIRVTGAEHIASGFIGGALQLEDNSLTRAITDLIGASEITREGIRARLTEKLGRPLPELDETLQHLLASGALQENRVGQRVTYKLTGHAA